MSITNPISNNILTLPDVSDTLITTSSLTPLNTILSTNGITNSTNILGNINTLNTGLSANNTILSTNGINGSTNVLGNIGTINTSLSNANTKISEL